ncbi:MAG TPA: hypothetical protein VIQ30_11820, partial [Pseudonocardia sp.]
MSEPSNPVANEPGEQFTNDTSAGFANGPVNDSAGEAGARVYGFPNRAAQPDHDDDGYPGRPPDGAGIVVDGQVLDETADT